MQVLNFHVSNDGSLHVQNESHFGHHEAPMQGTATTAENSASGLLENKEELKSFICTELLDILKETKSEFCLPSFHQHNFDEQSPRINTTNVIVEPDANE